MDGPLLRGALQKLMGLAVERVALRIFRAVVQKAHARRLDAERLLRVERAHAAELQQEFRRALGIRARIDENGVAVLRRKDRRERRAADTADALDEQRSRREQRAGIAGRDERITAALRQHSCAQHERRVRMLLHDRGGIAVHVHHILGIGKLHAVRERIPALGLHAGKDIRAAADQNDLHAELLCRLQCTAHHGIRGVVASHCIQNDFHACSLISPWPPGAQATGWQWPDSCLLFHAPAARAGR